MLVCTLHYTIIVINKPHSAKKVNYTVIKNQFSQQLIACVVNLFIYKPFIHGGRCLL